MAEKKRLMKKQLAVIDDLFGDELSEQQVLERHKVSRAVYNKWQNQPAFIDEFARRIAALNRQSAVLIARYGPLAAAKLVQLLGSEKEETARKACLDIISAASGAVGGSAEPAQGETSQPAEQISAETAGRLLAALADEKSK